MSGWGIQAPESVKVSWGARAIYAVPASIDIVPDRQGLRAGEEKENENEALIDWINKKGLPGLKKILRGEHLSREERRIVEFKSDGYVLKASPQGSYGYLYLGAWKEEEVADE